MGYNCAQSVAMAFCDLMGMDESAAARLASPFGGGMGCLRETCGAFTGALLVLGRLYGYDSPTDDALKAQLYADVRTLAAEFTNNAGSLICRDLLGEAAASTPSKRTAEYYASRPCPNLVAMAAGLVEAYIAAHSFETRHDVG